MKITKSQLKRIIKEEIHKTLREYSTDPRAQQLTADLSDVLGIEYEDLMAQLENLVDQTSPEVSVQPGPDDPMDDDDDEIPMMEEKDDNWIQDAEKDIERRGTEGVCTGKNFGSDKCPPGSKRYNLAKTFRKMAKDRKKK